MIPIALFLFLIGTVAAQDAPTTTTVSADSTPAAKPSGPKGSDIYTKLTRFGVIMCDNAKLRIEIEREQLASPIERYSLQDGICKPTVTDTHIAFEFTSGECGTAFEGNETHWLISNAVNNIDIRFPPMPGSMQLHNHQRGTFRCAYQKILEAAPVTFSSSLIDYEYPLAGLTASEVTFNLYTDRELSQPVDVSRKMKLNSTLYAMLARRAIGDTGTFIVPHECYAYSEADPEMMNPMLKDACWAQPTFVHLSHTNDAYLFSFPVFGFVARGETIRVQCTVNTCKTGHVGDGCKIPTTACDFGNVDAVNLPKDKPAAIVRRSNKKRQDAKVGSATANASFTFEALGKQSDNIYEDSNNLDGVTAFENPTTENPWISIDELLRMRQSTTKNVLPTANEVLPAIAAKIEVAPSTEVPKMAEVTPATESPKILELATVSVPKVLAEVKTELPPVKSETEKMAETVTPVAVAVNNTSPGSLRPKAKRHMKRVVF